jgi:methylated-DNA-[protein]-cysteine S-methyltransferase
MRKRIITPTPFGPVAVLWSPGDGAPRVARILLSQPGRSAEEQASALYPDSREASCAEIDAVARGIQGFLAGEDIAFSLDLVDLGQCPPFQQSVLRAEHRIPRGSVSTYRLIAEHLGKRNGARAVGNALAHNPFPLIVPCHRAIRSDLHLGGFQGGLAMKRALLEREGIALDDKGRVIEARFHYYGREMSLRGVQQAADAILWPLRKRTEPQ